MPTPDEQIYRGQIADAAVEERSIADQAVSIDKLVAPVSFFLEEQRGESNQTLGTTAIEYTTITVPVPSWAGRASLMVWAYAQITDSTGSEKLGYVSARIGDVDDGGANFHVPPNTTGSGMHIEERQITSPGPTITVACWMGISASTNSANQGSVWVWAGFTRE